MEFIERWFGFSPDHGDGSFEAMILIALVIIISGVALGFFRKYDVRKWINRTDLRGLAGSRWQYE